MSSTTQTSKTIHFPGGSGQRRQVQCQIVAGPAFIPGVVFDTKIVFIEDGCDPAQNDPDWGFILSQDVGSEIIPSYLVNKVLDQELSGCRLDFIKVYFLTEPDPTERREVYRWDITADVDHPKGNDPSRSEIRIYRSRWDQVKALLRIPGAAFESKGLTDNPPRADVYAVQVAAVKPRLEGQERLEILQALGLGSKVL